jgi:DNA-directed RNA polymerase subunit RPC12/RpoP
MFSINTIANISQISSYVNSFNHILSSKHELNEGFNSIDLNIDYLYCNFIYIYVKTNNENETNLNGTLYINDHSSYIITNNLCSNENNIYICDFYRDQRCNGNKFINSKLNIMSNVTGSLYITYICPNYITYDYVKAEMNFIDLIYYNLDEIEDEIETETETETETENETTITRENRNLIISTFFVDLFNNTNSDTESNKLNKEFILYKNLLLNYEKQTAIKSNENNITCSITFDQIDNNEYYYKCIQCNNSFSMNAFKQWIEEQSATCPTCRYEYKTYPQLLKLSGDSALI